MSKQLVMENYVDECLDEVEIRGIFIQEGIMRTPFDPILKKLYTQKYSLGTKLAQIKRSLWSLDQDRSSLSKVLKTHKDPKYTAIYNNRLKNVDKNINIKNNDFNSLNNQKKELMNVINNLEKSHSLGNVPYLYQIIGATLIVAAVAYSSYKLYKRFMSKAAKACQGKKGKTKTICMNQYQIKGLELSKKPLIDGMKGCSKAKEVQACKAKFNKKINVIDKKIDKKKNKIKKLAGK